MTWTTFWDMHSGGGTQEPPYEMIYIEAPEAEARVIFFNRFGHNPSRVSCTCCGDDYSVSEDVTLAQATGYHRNCAHLATPRVDGRYVQPDDPWYEAHYYVEPEDEAEAERRGFTVELNAARRIGVEHGSDFGRYLTVEQYAEQPNVLVIRASEIASEERSGTIPAQDYVWVD